MSGTSTPTAAQMATATMGVPLPKALPYAAMGTMGLRQSSGFIWEDYDPSLRGINGAKTYDRMKNDPTVAAILWAIESALRGVTWDCVPALLKGAPDDAKPSDDAIDGAEWLKDVLFVDMHTTWPDFIAEALSVLAHGFSLHEIVYCRRADGTIGIDDLEPRAQDTIIKWVFDGRGRTLGAVQQTAQIGGEIALPIEKLVHVRVRSNKRSPEGVSLLRPAHRSWVYASNLENIEAIGLERDLAGIPLVKIPQRTMDDAAAGVVAARQTVDEFARIARDLRLNQQTGVVIASDTHPTPDGTGLSSVPMYSIELISASSNRAASSDPVIRRHRSTIATTVLADFIMLGQQGGMGKGSGGSHALSADKTDFFTNSLAAILQSLAATFQSSIVNPLWSFNGFPVDLRPKLTPGPISETAVQELTQAVLQLSQAGARMFPDTALENFLRTKLGFPPLSAETIDASNVALAGGPPLDGTTDANPNE